LIAIELRPEMDLQFARMMAFVDLEAMIRGRLLRDKVASESRLLSLRNELNAADRRERLGCGLSTMTWGFHSLW
jgi:hypothetical protein